MNFIKTSAKYARLRAVLLVLFNSFVMTDILYGHVIRQAYGELTSSVLFIWVLGGFFFLDTVAIGAMLGPFYAYGGKVWTRGGREQFAIVGGYSLQTISQLTIQVLVILVYPQLRAVGIIVINSGLTITIICAVLMYLVCNLLARLLFRKVSGLLRERIT